MSRGKRVIFKTTPRKRVARITQRSDRLYYCKICGAGPGTYAKMARHVKGHSAHTLMRMKL
jgi:hypothetical protein